MTHRISFSVTYLDSLPGVGVKDSEEFVRGAIERADKDDSGTITDVSVTLIEFEEVN